MIAGSRSFAAIGQWAADAGPEALAVLGAARGPAEESTFRRAFALVSADVLDRVLGAWLHTRAVLAGGWLVIAIDGKTVRGAKSKEGKAPHLVAALAHGIGAVLGQVAVDAKSNEIPAVRDLLKAFASLASAVVTIDAMHTQSDTAQVILSRGADYVMTVKGNMPTLGHLRISEVNRESFFNLLVKVLPAEEASQVTIRATRVVLSAMCQMAFDEGYRNNNPYEESAQAGPDQTGARCRP